MSKPKRPITVWIAQILLLLIAVAFVLMQFIVLATVVVQSPAAMLLGLVMIIVFLGVLPFTAFVGMTLRKNWGRWLGVGFFSFFLIMVTVAQILQPDGPIKRYEYANNIQLISGIITQIVFTGLFLFLILRLAFAGNVSRFFTDSGDNDTIDSRVSIP